jgi:RNA polymerase sigma factor (sigma-70 family)
MGEGFTRAAEIAYQRYFAERERLWDRTPAELDAFPRAEALLYEMVADDWLRRRLKALEPLRMLEARLQAGSVDPDGELGQELAKIAKDPQPFIDRLDEHLQEQGDLGYELGIAEVGAALEAGEQERALQALKRVTGRDWTREFEEKAEIRGIEPADALSEVLSAVWELIAELSEKGSRGEAKRYSDQRAAMATAIRNTIDDYLEGKKTQRLDNPPADEADAVVDPAPPGAPSDLSPEEHAELNLLLEEADLSERQREALRLRLRGLEGEGLAKALGVKPSTARVHIHNAIKKLRKSTLCLSGLLSSVTVPDTGRK